MPGNSSDWTTGPAKWFAVVVLGGLAASAFAWTAWRGHAANVGALPRPAEVGTIAPMGELASAQGADRSGASKDGAAPGAHKAGELTKKINLNTATEAELDLLPGIGPALAKRIIEYRTTHGPFTAIEQLDAVKGIGPKMMAKLREHVTIAEGPGAMGPAPTRR